MGKQAFQASRWLLWALAVLAGLGILVSGYLVSKRFTGGSLACTRWAECDVVNNSVYSRLFGIPVSAIGLAGYVLLLGLALTALRTRGDMQRRILLLNAVLTLGGVGFSVYLTYLEIYVIEALCAWCVASAAVITLLAIVNAMALRLGRPSFAWANGRKLPGPPLR
jgi:uncharacterized membrane protein